MDIEVTRYRTKFEAELVAERVVRAGIRAVVQDRDDGWVVAAERGDHAEAREVIALYEETVATDKPRHPRRSLYGWVVIATWFLIPVAITVLVILLAVT